ncbi:MAG: PEP-utilizing enzyme [Patescibacteria group bacterium]
MAILYEKHRREYTVVGVSSAFQSFFKEPFRKLYNAEFSEIIILIKDGVFYHYQVLGERETVSQQFLKRINNNEIDLEKKWQQLDKLVSKYEQLISRKQSEFSLEMIDDFYDYYQEIMPIAYASMDAIDFIDELDVEKRPVFQEWATKTRIRSELVYKNGEMKFVPRFLAWFVEYHLPTYTTEQLEYLVFTELQAFINEDAALPTSKELEARKSNFYVRHFGHNEIEFFEGEAVDKVVEEKKLLKQPSDQLENIKEFTGQIAQKGIVRGKVRRILASSDMDDFQEGEIIVSSMTQPNYLPIMKKASAFVTNDGGMLCHAAIVARELKKPCIIGTKIATHALKDGDEIEVDANNGIVRIVSKA